MTGSIEPRTNKGSRFGAGSGPEASQRLTFEGIRQYRFESVGISGKFMTESGADVVAIEMLELEIDKVGNATSISESS